jgi:YidC/Oxa1 family membrane protein insertase
LLPAVYFTAQAAYLSFLPDLFGICLPGRAAIWSLAGIEIWSMAFAALPSLYQRRIRSDSQEIGDERTNHVVIFDVIIKGLVEALRFFYAYTHSWGWAIVILTVVTKLILFPTSVMQTKAMNKMKKVQPKLKEIQEKYKDRPDEMQRRTMEVYKTEKFNPFGSCLPMLLQFPFMIAIFWILSDLKIMGDVIKDSPFLWFHLKDHDIGLAVFSGASTFLMQKLTTPSTGADMPQQKVLLYIMPVFFGYITYTFSAAVGVYWAASNLVGIVQQYLINEYFVIKEHIQHHDETPTTPAPAGKRKK